MLSYDGNWKVVLVAFLITALLGPVIIPMLRKLKIGQSVREEGPQSHLVKTGTPTMGGLIFIAGILLTLLVFLKDSWNEQVIVVLLSMLAFGLIGFLDDYLIVVRKNNDGLSERQKLVGQILFAIILAVYKWKTSDIGTNLIIPFVKYRYLDLGVLYIPFLTFVIVGTVNSVNLTDGLDGLASSVTLIVAIFFMTIASKWGMTGISLFAAALAGGCLGFLVHNANPAKVFMGDTGSLALGGAVSAMAVIMDLPLILPIVGGIYFIETLSVIIQVTSFKLRGKRVFLMSPLHHHYEEKGWKETKVVTAFVTVTVILAIVAYMAVK